MSKDPIENREYESHSGQPALKPETPQSANVEPSIIVERSEPTRANPQDPNQGQGYTGPNTADAERAGGSAEHGRFEHNIAPPPSSPQTPVEGTSAR